MFPVTTFYIFFSSLFISFLMVPPLSNLAIKLGGVDAPDERKVHTREIPRLGGIAIFCAFLFSAIFFCEIDSQIKGFLSGAIIIFLTGLADDLTTLTPKQKFCGEIVAATVAVMVGKITLTSLGDPLGLGEIGLGAFAVPFTVFAIVGVTNAINLIDGLDGLAAGISALVCLAFGTLAYQTGNFPLLTLITALLGAVVGFLRYNTYPATIFMGDSGSLLLGYCAGVFSVLLVTSEKPISCYVPLIVLAVPIVDTVVVMLNRLLNGNGLFSPDRTHIHHRLLEMGIGHKYTVILVYGITYILSAFAVFFRNYSDPFLILILLSGSVVFYALVHLLRNRSFESYLREIRSNQPIRETKTYRTLVELSHRLLVLIKYLLLLILLFAAFTPVGTDKGLIIAAGCLLVLFSALLLVRSEWGNLFLQFVLYFNGAFILFVMENYGRATSHLGVPLLSLSSAIFSALLLLEGVKILLRNRTSQLLNTPFEYLVLFIVIAVPLLPKEITATYHLLTVAAKSVVLFVAYQLILVRQTKKNRKIILVTYVAMLAFVSKIFW